MPAMLADKSKRFQILVPMVREKRSIQAIALLWRAQGKNTTNSPHCPGLSTAVTHRLRGRHMACVHHVCGKPLGASWLADRYENALKVISAVIWPHVVLISCFIFPPQTYSNLARGDGLFFSASPGCCRHKCKRCSDRDWGV